MSHYTTHPIETYDLYYANLDKPRVRIAKACQEAWDLLYVMFGGDCDYPTNGAATKRGADLNEKMLNLDKALYNAYVSLGTDFDGVTVGHQIKTLSLQDFAKWLLTKDFASLYVFSRPYHITSGLDNPEGSAPSAQAIMSNLSKQCIERFAQGTPAKKTPVKRKR